MDRRGFIKDIIILAAAPAFIKLDNLMPVKVKREVSGIYSVRMTIPKQIGKCEAIWICEEGNLNADIQFGEKDIIFDLVSQVRDDMDANNLK